MPTFSNRPIGRQKTGFNSFLAQITPQVRRHPVLFFGLPFVLTIVASSFGLSYMTQTRYDYNATKVQSMSKEEELGMRKDRRKIDIREEYYRLQAKDSELEEWEPKRIPRPEGLEEPLAPRSKKLYAEGVALKAEKEDEKDQSIIQSSKPVRKDVILGPDGKPCRACNSKLAFTAALRTGKTPMGGKSEQSLPVKSEKSIVECPPDGNMLGQSTWTFLHSAAAYYPNSPTEIQQTSMISLIQSLQNLYPCHTCAESLSEELKRESKEKKSWEGGQPLQKAVQTGPGLRKWLCGLHNEVNSRLGKPTWTCDEGSLQQRWLNGPPDGRCD